MKCDQPIKHSKRKQKAAPAEWAILPLFIFPGVSLTLYLKCCSAMCGPHTGMQYNSTSSGRGLLHNYEERCEREREE